MQCDTSAEPRMAARQPLSPRTNNTAAICMPQLPSHAPKRLLAPPSSLPPPAYVREHGLLLSSGGPLAFLSTGQCVKRITWAGRSMVVKYGPRIKQAEADVMKIVKEKTRVPVTEVLGTAFDDATGETFIYQEFIDGATLTAAWSTLSPPHIARIQSDLSRHLAALAALDFPPDATLGSFDATSPWRLSEACRALFSHKPEPSLRTVGEFRRWLRFEIGRRSRALAGRSPAFDLERWFDSEEVGLVHADLHGGNIIVKDGRIAAIIDWGLAAWMPPAAELLALIAYRKDPDLECCEAMAAFLETLDIKKRALEGLEELLDVLMSWPDEQFEGGDEYW